MISLYIIINYLKPTNQRLIMITPPASPINFPRNLVCPDAPKPTRKRSHETLPPPVSTTSSLVRRRLDPTFDSALDINMTALRDRLSRVTTSTTIPSNTQAISNPINSTLNANIDALRESLSRVQNPENIPPLLPHHTLTNLTNNIQNTNTSALLIPTPQRSHSKLPR